MSSTSNLASWFAPVCDEEDGFLNYPGCDHPYHEYGLWGKKSFCINYFVTHEPFITPSNTRLAKINASLSCLTEENSDYFVESDPNAVMHWQQEAAKLGAIFRFRCIGEFTNTKVRVPQRTAFWSLVKETPNINWLVGTRHPHLISASLPKDWSLASYPNVTLVMKLKDDDMADAKIGCLHKVEAAYRLVIWDVPLDYNGARTEMQFV
jgi:hypothetical protein